MFDRILNRPLYCINLVDMYLLKVNYRNMEKGVKRVQS